MRSNTIISIVVSITLISTILIGVPMATGDGHQAGYGTMTIDGDAEFASMASKEGWPGNGSASDPYLIRGYDIDADHIGSCIMISNTTSHFVLSDSTLISGGKNGSDPGCGIFLTDVSNGTIDNVSCLDCEFSGVYLDRCPGITIIGSSLNDHHMAGLTAVESNRTTVRECHCDHSQMGIHLYGSNNCTLECNSLSGNQDSGVLLEWSNDVLVKGNLMVGNTFNVATFFTDRYVIENNTIRQGSVGINTKDCLEGSLLGNEMEGCSIQIIGTAYERRIECFVSMTIDDNTVNGKPVHFYKNLAMENESVPSDAGMVILANVTGAIIQNIQFSEVSIGVLVGYSSAITMRDCAFQDCIIGAEMMGMEGSTISNCAFHGTNNGLDLYSCEDCTVSGCNASGNSNVGLYLEGSFDCQITENVCLENDYGIYLTAHSYGNIISRNTCSFNEKDGLYLWASPMNRIENNTCSANTMNGISTWLGSDECVVENNNLEDNPNFSAYSLSCEGMVIRSNHISGGEFGIFLYSSSDATVSNNILVDLENGIDLLRVERTLLLGNEMHGCSILLEGEVMEYHSTHNMTGNTVNGLPVEYIASSEMTGEVFSRTVGELILANVTGLTVNLVEVANGTTGFMMGFCNDIWLVDCAASSCMSGIVMYGCQGCTVLHSNISENQMGIVMEGSNDSLMVLNLLEQNEGYAIQVEGSSANHFWGNALIGNNGATSEYSSLHIQVYDDSTDGSWSESGWGNHWSDWTGPDSNGDGLVDVPYTINEALDDSDPLVSMIGPPAYPRIVGTGDAYVTLNWLPLNYSLWTPPDHYSVYRSDGESEPVLLVMLPPSTFGFIDNSVVPLKEYAYFITSGSSIAESPMDRPLNVFVPSSTFCLVTGSVLDEQDRPVSGAKVGSDEGSYTFTDEQGHFDLVVEKGHRVIGVIAPGLNVDPIPLTLDGNLTDLGAIIMEEAPQEDIMFILTFLGMIAGILVIVIIATWWRGRVG